MDTGAISGTVFGLLTGDPLTSASVYTHEVDGYDMALTETEAPGGTYFLTPLLAPGEYEVRAKQYDYGVQVSGPVQVLPGQTAVMDFALPYAGGVSGTVCGDLAGSLQAIAGAGVRAFRSPWPYGVWEAATDAQGLYAAYDLDADIAGAHFALEVQAPGFTSQVREGVWVPAPLEKHTVTAVEDFLLELSGWLDGTVQDDLGNPVADATVYACPSGGSSASTEDYATTTDLFGEYELLDLEAGQEYLITVDADGFCTAQQSKYVPVGVGVVANATLVPAARITGTIMDASEQPVEGALVFAVITDDPSCQYASVLSGPDGGYELGNLDAPDTVDVLVSKNGVGAGSYDGVSVYPDYTTEGVDIQL
jgi:hypothetical protein